MVLRDLPPGALRALAVPFGMLWGSFLNVVIYRLPRDMSVVRPPSHCPGCGKPIAPYDNLPVLSYVILRGKARCCGAKMSPRYPIVELLGGLACWAVVDMLLTHMAGSTSLLVAGASFAANFALILGLIAAAFIDWEHMYLPDSITLGGTALGLLTCPLRGEPFAVALFGGALGFIGVWLPFIVIYKRLRGMAGMGMGDAKLLMLAGVWGGWFGALFVLLAGALQGTLAALALYLAKGKIEEPESVTRDREELKKAAAEGDAEAAQLLADDPIGLGEDEGAPPRIAFGPFLIVAIAEFMFLGDRILQIARAYYFIQ